MLEPDIVQLGRHVQRLCMSIDKKEDKLVKNLKGKTLVRRLASKEVTSLLGFPTDNSRVWLITSPQHRGDKMMMSVSIIESVCVV